MRDLDPSRLLWRVLRSVGFLLVLLYMPALVFIVAGRLLPLLIVGVTGVVVWRVVGRR